MRVMVAYHSSKEGNMPPKYVCLRSWATNMLSCNSFVTHANTWAIQFGMLVISGTHCYPDVPVVRAPHSGLTPSESSSDDVGVVDAGEGDGNLSLQQGRQHDFEVCMRPQ